MEKKVYLIYQSSKGCKDLVHCTTNKASAFSVAERLKSDNTAIREANPDYPVCNFRVYEMPLND